MGGKRRGFVLAAVVATLVLATAPAAGAQSIEPHVVGGSPASTTTYPWQGAVAFSAAQYPSSNAYQRQFCGGSLVTASIVITAAHCLNDSDPDCSGGGGGCSPSDPGGDGTKKIDPNDISVILGRTTLSDTGTGVEHLVRDVSFHSGFNPSTFQNDVGYLVLQTPSAQQAIDIAGSDESPVWAPGTMADISGWGSTSSGGDGVDTLRAASDPIVSDSTCGSSAVYGAEFDAATMVCAGYLEGGVDTCQGDSGGPMQSPLAGGGYRLTGITSWGVGCARPNRPGVYTRIADATLRAAAAAKVSALETTYSLPHENIVGSGGQPASGDSDPPETTIGSGPSGFTNDATPTFGFSSDEAGSTFECRFDSAAFAPCSGPGATHTAASSLTDGAHTFEVRAIDPADNIDPLPASRSFTVDTQAPANPALSSSSHVPGVASTDNTVDVNFSGASDSLSGVDGFSFQWSTSSSTIPDTIKDAEQGATATTSPALAAGTSHYFHLRTRDNAGNWSVAVHLGPFVITGAPPPPPPPPDPTPTPPPSTPSPDTAAPLVTASADPKQRAGGPVIVSAGCNEPCSIEATGVVVVKGGGGKRRFKLVPAGGLAAAGGAAELELSPKGGKAGRAIRGAVRRGARARAKLTLVFIDLAGNSTEAQVAVKLR